MTGEDNHYLVRYDPDHAINNQAIAYKKESTGEIAPMKGWALLESIEEGKEEHEMFELVKLNEKPVLKGKVAFMSDEIEDVGLKVGDVVGFKENRDYRINIDDKEYYRTRVEDLLYVEEV